MIDIGVQIQKEVREAAGVLANQGLVNAFGHVSARLPEGASFEIVRPPLGFVTTETELVSFPLDADELPAGVPGEAWIHWAIYRSRTEVGAVCRAQPPSVAAAAAAGVTIEPLHGHGAFLGRSVPVFDDARLIRSRESGQSVAQLLSQGNALVLRGNGAVTTGSSVAAAVARMWALEASAQLNLAAAVAGKANPLSDEELRYWQGVEGELLERIWAYLKRDTERAQRRPS